MKLQHIFLSIGLLFCLYQPLKAQDFSTDKKAVWLTFYGRFSEANSDGVQYETSNTSIGAAPAVFIAKNIFIGAQFKGIFTEEGHEWHIGPHIGYAFGGENKTHFPYITVGAGYTNAKTSFSFRAVNPHQPFTDAYYYNNNKAVFTGISTQIGIGYVISLDKHLALNVECGLQSAFLSHTATDNTKYQITTKGFYTGIGISAMLFK